MFFRSVFLFLLLSTFVNAQTWMQRYNRSGGGIDESVSLIPIANGTTIIAGSSFSAQTGWDVSAIAYDKNGSQLWRASYGSASRGDDKATCAMRDGSGNIYLGGISWNDTTGWDYLVIKMNASGVIQWSKQFNTESKNDDMLSAIASDSQGNVYLAGSSGFDVSTIMTMKCDASGNILWQQRFNPRSIVDEQAVALSIDVNGNAIVGGNRYGFPTSVLLLKYSTAGNELWSKVLNRTGIASDKLTSMMIDGSSQVYLAGASDGDVLVMKLNADGSTIWTRTYNGSGSTDDRAADIELDAQNMIVVTARSVGTTSGVDIVTIKYSNDGAQSWEAHFTGQGTVTDNIAPIFAGASGAMPSGETTARIVWASALDDQTERDDLEYLIFAANASGGQKFNSPVKIISGKLSGVIENLTPETDYFLVVRARDKGGNTDANKREFMVRTTRAQLRIVDDSLPQGQAGTQYPSHNLRVVNGTPPYSWSLSGGNEPTPNFLSGDGKISGFVSIPGAYPLEIHVTDSQNKSATKSLTLEIAPPPNFSSTDGATLPAGKYWFHDFLIRSGHTVNAMGNVTIHVTGKMMIEQTGRLASPTCDTLVLNLLSKTETPVILGDVKNDCFTAGNIGGDLVVRTVGNLQLGALTQSAQRGMITSSGSIYISDPWYSPRQERDTMTHYKEGIAAVKASPVCAIKGSPITGDGIFPAAINFEAIHKDPDGGSSKIAFIDYGDGTTISNPTAPLSHSFAESGLYRVLIVVVDDENDSSSAYMTLNLRPAASDTSKVPVVDAPSVWAAPATFTSDSLIKPFGTPFSFTSDKDTAAATIRWDYGEEQSPTGNSALITSTSAGSFIVTANADHPEGSGTSAMMTAYASFEGGQTLISDAATTTQPFPPLPPSFHPSPQPLDHADECSDCAFCADPFSAPGPVRVFGYVAVTPGSEGNTNSGAENATVFVMPSFSSEGMPGKNGTETSPNGKWSSAAAFTSKTGKLVMCGGSFTAAKGGNGFDRSATGCPAVVQAGNGGGVGSVSLTAPFGQLSFCGEIFVTTADGGNGGDATATGAGPGIIECMSGCGAQAKGGKGGIGGGGIYYNAQNICYDKDYKLRFGGVAFGGMGGVAVATGINGMDCGVCNVRSGDGGRASARGGKGGGSSWYFISRNAPSVDQLRNHILSGGTLIGGQGGNADSKGGDGGKSVCNGCTGNYALGGRGAAALSYGGKGGIGLPRGASGLAASTGGKGGDAVMNATPPISGDGCPGSPGCDSYARAGNGGYAYAAMGNGDEGIEAYGSGGTAKSTGGKGGNGTGCDCAGGRGGKAIAYGGRRGGAAGFLLPPVDGDAVAKAGDGGRGGNCCTPPGPKGGNGGIGGEATALAGSTGIYTATGGTGGPGGNGKPPGAGGGPGTAVGAVNGAAIPGGQGAPGDLCTISGEWYCYFSSIPDGTIQTGSIRLNVYDTKNASPANKVGEITVSFAGPAGAITKSGDSLKLKQGAALTFDFTTFTGGKPNPDGWPTWYPTKFESTFRNVTQFQCFELRGYFNAQQIANKLCENPGGANSVETISIAAGPNPGDKFDRTQAIATFFINIDHWGFRVTWTDP